MNRFIVVLDVASREQRNAVTALFQSLSWPVWHHMEDVWLLANVPINITPRAISESIEKLTIVGKHRVMVVRIPEGFSPYWGHASGDGWKWMTEFWGQPG